MSGPKRRRIMHEFRLDKIAAVDHPCQEHARAAIMKRALREEEGHMEGIKKAGGSGDAMETAMNDAEKIADLEKKLGTATAALALANNELAKAKTAASDAVEEMTEAKDDCKKAQDELAKVKSDLIAKGDETIVVAGQEVKKSAVGDATFAIFKAQQEQLDTARLEKRADDEFGSLPGSSSARATILKAIEGIADEEVRKQGIEILNIAKGVTEGAFKQIGHTNPVIHKGAADFKKRVDTLMSDEKIGKTAAMSKARSLYPDEYEAYQAAN